MSRTKAHWRRLSVWVESFKQMGEGWAYLQTWDNPPATMGTMAGMTALCCYPHITVSLAATALVIYMVCPRLPVMQTETCNPLIFGRQPGAIRAWFGIAEEIQCRACGCFWREHAC